MTMSPARVSAHFGVDRPGRTEARCGLPMNFVSCDWGTTNFRLRLAGLEAGPEVRTDEGAARLAAAGADRAEAFRSVIRRGLAELGAPPDWPVVISGMASSSIGWRELPYAGLPFALDGSNAVTERVDGRHLLVSGICGGSEMLRGEETQALGLAALLGPELPANATLVLPGTHSKHLTLGAGAVTAIRTFMTGELFDLLTRHSVLRHSTAPGGGLDSVALAEGVAESQRQPLAAALFRVRTRQVLDRCPPAANTSFLSGLLIGAELAALASSSAPLIIAAGGDLCPAYAAAAAVLGMGDRVRAVDSAPLTTLGQQVLLGRLAPASR